MATLREVKTRIRSVQSTKRITKAMEMVAAAKMRKAQQRVEQAKPYAEKLNEMLGHLAAGSSVEISHPYFEERPIKRKTLVVVVSDRGLCGSFNSNVFRKADGWVAENKAAGFEVELVLIGKRARDYYKRRQGNVVADYCEWNGVMDYARAREIAGFLTERFTSGETDEITFLYTRFISLVSYRVTAEKYLPVARPEVGDEEGGAASDYIFEPSSHEIYAALMPSYANTKMITALTESLASEHGSRMMAMGNATKNAGEMVEHLTLEYNKARQAQITGELLEVVAGADALAD